MVLDGAAADDAGAVRLEGGHVLLHTVDVITPIVDDPETFGRVAAANAVSDIYAMGGRPTSAVSVLAVPKGLPVRAVRPMLAGASALLAECGAHLIGGHTLKDAELKLGFAVTGTAQTRQLATHTGARAGQLVVLTKALGTGLCFTAAKQGGLAPEALAAWTESMATPNRAVGQALAELGVRAATDVTGFGLAGHAAHIATGSGVDLVIEASQLPVLDGARVALAAGLETGPGKKNYAAYRSRLAFGRSGARVLACDPQTSGGLLFTIPERRLGALRGLPHWVVGETRPPKNRHPRVRFEP